jgi:hypothetical protein
VRVDEISDSLSNIDDRVEKTKRAVEAKAHYDEVITRLEKLAQQAKDAGAYSDETEQQFRFKMISDSG